jgi:beta-hydroxylase
MIVGGETVRWREGRCFVFDDSMVHRVSNGTNEERAILLFDFDRPMRWPASALNRLAMSLLKRTAYYRDARRNLKKHARAQMSDANRDQAIADAMRRIAD